MQSRMAGVELRLEWESDEARHADRLYVPRLDFWRDILPGALGPKLETAPPGASDRETFGAGELVPAHDANAVRTIRDSAFQRRFGHLEVEPRVGRFYPLGMIAGDLRRRIPAVPRHRRRRRTTHG